MKDVCQLGFNHRKWFFSIVDEDRLTYLRLLRWACATNIHQAQMSIASASICRSSFISAMAFRVSLIFICVEMFFWRFRELRLECVWDVDFWAESNFCLSTVIGVSPLANRGPQTIASDTPSWASIRHPIPFCKAGVAAAVPVNLRSVTSCASTADERNVQEGSTQRLAARSKQISV